MNKQELLDRINESLVFALKQIPASEKQIPNMEFSTTLAFLEQAKEDLEKLETMK